MIQRFPFSEIEKTFYQKVTKEAVKELSLTCLADLFYPQPSVNIPCSECCLNYTGSIIFGATCNRKLVGRLSLYCHSTSTCFCSGLTQWYRRCCFQCIPCSLVYCNEANRECSPGVKSRANCVAEQDGSGYGLLVSTEVLLLQIHPCFLGCAGLTTMLCLEKWPNEK